MTLSCMKKTEELIALERERGKERGRKGVREGERNRDKERQQAVGGIHGSNDA